jgi:serine/threonine-protein kinase
MPSFPNYEILAVLGRGGMGVVYKARDLKLKRLVALKVILAGVHAGEQALGRFKAEAEAIAQLQHPNIVQIHEVGEHDGKPFISLEYCTGGSLDKLLAGTPLPPRDAAQLVQTLAQAMHAAHQARVIHRDLKPANILLQSVPSDDQAGTPKAAGAKLQAGIPKITDFGLARKLAMPPRRSRAPSWARRRTWRRSRPEAKSVGSAPAPTSTRWERSFMIW